MNTEIETDPKKVFYYINSSLRSDPRFFYILSVSADDLGEFFRQLETRKFIYFRREDEENRILCIPSEEITMMEIAPVPPQGYHHQRPSVFIANLSIPLWSPPEIWRDKLA